MLKLVGPGESEGIEITPAGILVGRERGCDVVVASQNASREHARVTLRETGPCVEDLNSANGTKVNEVRIKGLRELRPGDKITFGDVTFVLIDKTPPSRARRIPRVKPAEAKSAEVEPVERRTAPPTNRPDRSAKADSQETPSPEPEPSSQTGFIRGVCAALMVCCLIAGFMLGRVARGLGRIEIPGEQAARSYAAAEAAGPAESLRINQSEGPESETETPDPQTSQAAASSTAASSESAGVSISPAARAIENAKRKAATESDKEMSLGESAKTIRLLKEVKKSGIDLADADGVRRIAMVRLKMTREEADRASRLLVVMGERDALLKGGLNALDKVQQPTLDPNKSLIIRPPPPQTSEVDSQLNQFAVPPTTPDADAPKPEPEQSPTAPAQVEQKGQAEKKEKSEQSVVGAAGKAPPAEKVAADPQTPAAKPASAPVRGPGYYMNVWGLALVIGLLALWLFGIQWMDRDAGQFDLNHQLWLQLTCVAGPLGALLALYCSDLGFGMMLQSGLLGAPFLAYLAVREERVPNRSRLLRSIAWLNPATDDEAVDEPAPLEVELLSSNEAEQKLGGANSPRFDDSPGIRAAKALIAAGIIRRASDIHLEPEGEQLSARLRIDGVMSRDRTFTTSQGRTIVNVFKVIALMDISERRRPQDGSFRARVGEEILNIRVASQGTSQGEKLSLRLLRDQEELSNLAGLGLNRKLQGELRDIVQQPHGLFLVCGPTGAGKSTTLRSALGELDPYVLNIITIENPVEYRIEGVTQIEITQKTGQNFATALRSVLRQDPDVIMVGEIRDLETATAACQSANTGHLVLSTIHANDTLTAVHRLMDLGADPFSLADALTAVLGQRLIRRLCPDCRLSYRPDLEVLRRCRIPAERAAVFYRPPKSGQSDCATCSGTGYRGRIGIFELLIIDDAVRALIRERASPTQIRNAARRRGMTTIRENGFRLVIRGLTSLEEVQSATREEGS